LGNGQSLTGPFYFQTIIIIIHRLGQSQPITFEFSKTQPPAMPAVFIKRVRPFLNSNQSLPKRDTKKVMMDN